jgi:hypothetical protein
MREESEERREIRGRELRELPRYVSCQRASKIRVMGSRPKGIWVRTDGQAYIVQVIVQVELFLWLGAWRT